MPVQMTKLQLDDKKDLLFVHDQICQYLTPEKNEKFKEVLEKLPKEEQAAKQLEIEESLKQKMDRVLDIVGLNCQINGMDYEYVADTPLQNYEPLDEQLAQELEEVEQKVNEAMKKVCERRQQFLLDFKEQMQKVSEFKQKQLQRLSQIEPLNLSELDMTPTQMPTGQWMGQMQGVLEQMEVLLEEVPPAVSKLERLGVYLEDELGNEENFEQHLKQYQKSVKSSRLSKPEIWKRQILAAVEEDFSQRQHLGFL